MKNKIIILTDYLGRFGSKHNAFPYRSGMDKHKLKQYFYEYGFEAVFVPFSEVNFRKNEIISQYVLYTSQEDPGCYYKSYIEDIVYGLELLGAKVIPPYKYLRANNNKVFMEILRDQLELPIVKNIKSYHFGTLEECLKKADLFEYPVVIKGAEGAMSKNVTLAKSKTELFKKVKKLSRTKNYKEELREFVRSFKYEGYKKQSKCRKKFIVQNFIPNLKNDWKVLIFYDKYFIFQRNVRKNDFRASGSGQDKYYYGSSCPVPDGIFDFARIIFNKLNVPQASLDIAFNGKEFFLLEYQLLYFGTVGVVRSDCYYYFDSLNMSWIKKDVKPILEKEYVRSIVKYIEKNYNEGSFCKQR